MVNLTRGIERAYSLPPLRQGREYLESCVYFTCPQYRRRCVGRLKCVFQAGFCAQLLYMFLNGEEEAGVEIFAVKGTECQLQSLTVETMTETYGPVINP